MGYYKTMQIEDMNAVLSCIKNALDSAWNLHVPACTAPSV